MDEIAFSKTFILRLLLFCVKKMNNACSSAILLILEDLNIEKTKKCNKCGRELPLSAFRKQAACRDGLQNHCKTCGSLIEAERYVAKREKLLALSHAYNQKRRIPKI